MDRKTVQQLIRHYTKPQLQELVGYMADKSKTAQQALLDFCQKKEENVESDNYELIIKKQIDSHWSKAREIIAEFDRYGGGPESDEEDAYDELEKMGQLLKDNEVSWAVRKEVLDEMLTFVESDNSGFTDYLMDLALDLCKSNEEIMYLADFLAQYGGSYYGALASKLYLKCGEYEKYLKNQTAHMKYASDYMELANYYKKQGDEEQATKILWEGIRKCEGRRDEIYQYMFSRYRKRRDEDSLEKLYQESQKYQRNQDVIVSLMHQYYKNKGDYDKQKETIIKLFSCANGTELYQLYQDCKSELTAGDFAKEEKEILNTIKERQLPAYFEILMDKNETKEVIEYITRHQQYRGWGIDQGHCFSKRLAGQYPREVVKMYWQEVEFFVKLGQAKNYKRSVNVLKEIRKIMRMNRWDDEWEKSYSEFLQVHGRKRLLMGELASF